MAEETHKLVERWKARAEQWRKELEKTVSGFLKIF